MSSDSIDQKIKDAIEKTKRVIEEYKEMAAPVSPDNAIGRVSRMDAINNKAIAEASLAQAQVKLKNLEDVLAKVGTPDFGLCLKCKNPIPIERILIRPESLHCVNCAR